MKAVNVGRPIRAHFLKRIRDFILEKNTMEMVNVGVPLAKPLSFINISELTLLVRNPGNIMDLEKPLTDFPLILYIRECGETRKTH